jgi:hypothetical protein
VEEGSTIYRWLYGESILPHEHCGLVVRASNIINPQYVIADKVEKIDNGLIDSISSEDLR